MLLDITDDDIAKLSDTDLRSLVALLCEAELRARNLSTAYVTAGGDQDAKDGGLDVRIDLPVGTIISGFIPQSSTGFQVKRSDLQPRAIRGEMKPKGRLRPAIRHLGEASGAYIIVSGRGSTAASALQRRRDAMRQALRNSGAAHSLTVDFYDRNRLATWVRDHLTLAPWIRSRIGKPLSGWRPYGSWSRVPLGADRAYVLDEAARIRTGDGDKGDGLSAIDGINKIRDSLRLPGRVVRLVGLSGVGKTRLVEALFDSSVGANSLEPFLAIYSDTADNPDPQPVGLASDLIARRTQAVLIIDNCPPDVHRQLADVVISGAATLSVITIEYDIQDDQPEGTDVFVLGTSSDDLIEALLSRRFPALSQVDARTIAESAGGNARVALALADTVKKNETIAGLNDAELFRRVFYQRNDPEPGLLLIAQACSLVYSFEGETVSGEGAELPLLGQLIGRSPDEMLRGLVQLRRRDLLQKRGSWRAVLPHAIANRLAAMALEEIPAEALQTVLVNAAPPRLLRSFSRRLGYLDGSREARAIVEDWLTPGGLLAEVTNFNELRRGMFSNIAPVVPQHALSTLENALVDADDATTRKSGHFVGLLRSLAYDPALFQRAVALLVKFARVQSQDRSHSESEKAIESLFHVVLSGTHAPVQLRLSVVAHLLRSDDLAERNLGVCALQAMLKTSGFVGMGSFQFGARSRDYGYHPMAPQDVRDWFAAVLAFAEPFALSDRPAASQVRAAIARAFHGLWEDGGQADRLETFSQTMAARQFWREGWIAVRHTRTCGGKHLPPEAEERLTSLEQLLRPKDLVDRVRGVILGSQDGRFEFNHFDEVENGDYAAADERLAAAVENLGRDVAYDDAALAVLLPELIGGDWKLAGFGRGLGLAVEKPRDVWNDLVAELPKSRKPGVNVLSGFLSGLQERDLALADALLDEALNHPTLASWFPHLQTCIHMDEAAIGRLHRALDLDTASMRQFIGLAYRPNRDVIPGPEFARLVLKIGRKPDGMPVALKILAMRLHSDRIQEREPQLEMTEAGRALLEIHTIDSMGGAASSEDYELGNIVRASLVGENGKPIARKLCRDVMTAVSAYKMSGHDCVELMRGLFEVHPTEILDELFSGDGPSKRSSVGLLNDQLHRGKNSMDAITDETIINWCDRDAQTRYPLAAAVVRLIRAPNDNGPEEWTLLASQLLLRSPDPKAVFGEIVTRLQPRSWSGSLATKLESRVQLLERLDVSEVPALAVSLDVAKTTLKRQIESEHRRETEEGRQQSGRFE